MKISKIFENVLKLRKSLFIPMTLGGGIRDLKKAKVFLKMVLTRYCLTP